MSDSRGGLSGALSNTEPKGAFSIEFAEGRLKRGIVPLEPTTVPTLPAGESFTLEIPSQAIGLLLPAVQKVREAAARSTALELELKGGLTSSPASRKVSKVEAITVKQATSRGAFSWEITLRKL